MSRTRPGVAAVVLALAGCGTTVASDAPEATDASPVTTVTSAPRATSSASTSASSSISIAVSASASTSTDEATSGATTTTSTDTAGRDAMSTTTYHRTVVAADAGSVEAQYVDGVLDVHIESKEGWNPTVDRSAPNRVRVSWALGERIVAVEITADDVGLSSQVLTTG